MCPLCFCEQIFPLAPIDSKIYHRCKVCGLTFLSPEFHLNTEAQRSRYETHQNSPLDSRYRGFLSRMTDFLIPKLLPGWKGLDYGCGPGPTLSVMLEEKGFQMKIYDPYFAPQTDVLNRTYDFITCTETVEHFSQPGREFKQFNQLLRKGGWLGIQTEFLDSDKQFPSWWYRRDPTHICFWKRETMDWISQRFGWKVEFPRKSVALFQKVCGPTAPEF